MQAKAHRRKVLSPISETAIQTFFQHFELELADTPILTDDYSC